MKKKFDIWDIIGSCIIVIVIMFVIMGVAASSESIKGFDKGYKQGQIDALNGIQNYDKVATKDSVYVKIK